MVSGLLAKRMDRIFNGKRSRTSAHYGCVVFGANEEIVLLESSSQEIAPHLQHFFHFKCFFQRVCLGQNEAKLKTVEVESGEHIEFGEGVGRLRKRDGVIENRGNERREERVFAGEGVFLGVKDFLLL